MRLYLIYSSLNKQFLLNIHTHNFVLSFTSVWLIAIAPHLWINLYAAHTVLGHQGSEAKGGGGSWEKRFTSLRCLICRAPAGGCPRACVLQTNPPAARLKSGHAAPRHVRQSLQETAASSWIFLTALFTWAAPGVRARDPPHTWIPPPLRLIVRELSSTDSFLQTWLSESPILALAFISVSSPCFFSACTPPLTYQ